MLSPIICTFYTVGCPYFLRLADAHRRFYEWVQQFLAVAAAARSSDRDLADTRWPPEGGLSQGEAPETRSRAQGAADGGDGEQA